MSEIKFRENAINQASEIARATPKLARKIFELIEDISKNPFSGLGKPEPLKHHLSGLWSRRIDEEHRLIYEVGQGEITIISCKGHYQ